MNLKKILRRSFDGCSGERAAEGAVRPSQLLLGGAVRCRRLRHIRRFLDYLEMLNERDGGMNGVTFTWAKFDFSADPTSEDEINTPACRRAARALSIS